MYSQRLGGENSQSILVVDDAQVTRRMIALQLERTGFHVITAESGPQALDLVRRQGLPRLAVIDLSMPEMNGAALAEALRALGDVPVIFLATAMDTLELDDLATSYAAGILVKPFAFGELLESIQVALVRADVPPMSDVEAVIDSRLRVNFAQQYILLDGQRIALTPTETRLLHLLYCHRGRVVSPTYLMSKAWDPHQQGTLGSLWVHVRRLRNKIEEVSEAPRYLLTVRGQGYLLQTEPGIFPLTH